MNIECNARSLGGVLLAAAALMIPTTLHGQEAYAAEAPLMEATTSIVDSAGTQIGTATFTETPNEGVLIRLSLTNAPPGEHAVHVHETGRCEPAFSAAGDHYDPEGESHGLLHEEGSHAGDLPNVNVPEDGRLEIELVADDLTLRPNEDDTLFDEDGSALIMHARADDHRSQPSGDAGPEIACGVIER